MNRGEQRLKLIGISLALLYAVDQTSIRTPAIFPLFVFLEGKGRELF